MVEIIVTRDDITPALQGLQVRLDDLTEPVSELFEEVLSEARQRFVTKGPGPLSESWDSPSPRTRYGPGESLLVRSGVLLDSLSRDADFNLFEPGPKGGVFGTEVPYAGFQQSGTSRGIPPRPFLGFAPESFEKYDQIVLDWLLEELK